MKYRGQWKNPGTWGFLFALFITACEKVELTSGSIGEVPITLSASADTAILQQGDENNNAVTFSWNLVAVDTADSPLLEYYLQWDITGNQFQNTGQYTLGSGIDAYSFTVKELNRVLSPYYGADTLINLDVRLYAKNPSGSVKNTYYSNTIHFSVKMYRTNYIVISGFMANPQGSDAVEVGGTAAGLVHEGGGYEYVQLLVLKDIDFSQTPYSLVACNNGSVGEAGWATGLDVSYKFNLTAGFAAKGTYIYVGGASKRIDGYTKADGFSTDISEANWIRAIEINVGDDNVITGDGFGNSGSGFMGNDDDPADGVAVFYGTDVDAGSVPIDVVFYGSNIGKAYNSSNGYGYRIGNTDYYTITDPATGLGQPYLGSGTNTYLTAPAVSGSFSRLGGVIDANGTWVTPRAFVEVPLGPTSALTDIETNGTRVIN